MLRNADKVLVLTEYKLLDMLETANKDELKVSVIFDAGIRSTLA